MNKQQLQQEIEALQKQLEEKQKDLSSIPDKWEPKGGKFWISSEGVITVSKSSLECAQFGSEYATQEQAEKAAKAMRAHNRLLAWASEHVTCGWEADWGDFEQSKYFVLYDFVDNCWGISSAQVSSISGCVYMPKYAAKELAAKLNSGEVEL